MAEKIIIKKVEDQLNCSICLDTYTNPKLLQCFHVYCKDCIICLVFRDKKGKLSLTCPNCRQATPIPDTGVSGLQSAFYINRLLEIVEEYNKENDTAIGETTEDVAIKYHTTGKGLETAIVGEKSTAAVQAVTGSGCPCLELTKSVECELESMLTGARVRGVVEERGKGLYEISYQPVTKGRNQLHIRVEGLNIQGSPFDVSVKSPVEYCGIPIQMIEGIRLPRGVAMNHAGEVVISLMHSVAVFSPAGAKLRSFGTKGTGPGRFKHAMGVAVDCDGNILVADRNNNRIQKFTGSGQFLASVGTKGTGLLQFDDAVDIAFNVRCQKMCVVDSCNHRIQVLNSDLTLSSVIGGEHGSKNGQFNYPSGVACDSTGNVYIADSCNHRIQVFTSNGKFLMKFGCEGNGEGELNRPIGVAVDARGKVFVGDSFNHRVSVFTREGQFVTSFGEFGSKPGGFIDLRCLAVDDSGVLYVCDMSNNRVQMFSS